MLKSIPTMRAVMSAAILGLMATPVLAQTGSFVDVLTRDPSTTNAAGRLCYATNDRVDVGCSTTAPYLNPANGFLGLGHTSPSSLLDVSGTTTARGGIIVGRSVNSSRIWGLDAATFISFHWGQPDLTFHTNGARHMVIASTNLGAEYGGRVGIGNITYPSTTLHVSGTLRISNAGEACDTNRLGAIQYASGNFNICRNVINGWEPVATATSATEVAINTGLSGSIVFRDELGKLKARDDFSVSSTTGSIGIGYAAPYWVGSNGLYVSGSLGTAAGDNIPIIVQNQIPLLHTFTAPGTGGANLFVGKNAGNATMAYVASTSDASYNTGIGTSTLKSTTTGKYNTAIGWMALTSATSAGYNTAVGVGAMSYATGAGSNAALGAYALRSLTAGSDNVAVGSSALLAVATASRNTALGAYAMGNTSYGNDNTTVGHASMQFKSGSYNALLGKNVAPTAGAITATVALGFEAGTALTTSTSNTLVGYRAGANITTGSNNIMLGASTNALVPTGSNQLNIGNAVWGDLSAGTDNTNKLGINVTAPSTALHVSGTLRLANGGETCDTNRLGAIRYDSGRFDICQNIVNGWEPLATTGVNSAVDRITSNSMAGVTANATGYISLTTGGVTGTAYFSPNSVLVNRGISATESVSATRGYFTSNIGIGTPVPTALLDVSGAIKISGDGTEGCGTTTDTGKIRLHPTTGRLQVCVD